MKIEAKDLRSTERKPLQEVIPLDTPYTLFLDPTNSCTLKCSFCPTGDHKLLKKIGRKTVRMTENDFVKVVEGLREFPRKIKRVNMYKDGEPLLHPAFPWMVRKLKEANVADEIWVKTNGTLLSPEKIDDLISSGLDMIGISVKAVSTEGYKRITNANLDYEEFLKNISRLFTNRGKIKVYASIADYGMTPEEKEKFFTDFGPISDYCAIEGLHGWSMSSVKDFTLGTNPTSFDGLPLVEKTACPWVFYQMAINSDGTISACNEDWPHGVLIGDIHKNSLVEIWNGEMLYDLRIMMLEGRRKLHSVCGDCYYLKCAPDNIDMHLNEITKKIMDARQG